MRRPRHLRFLFGATVCFLSVCAAAVSSFAWFQINNSVAPSSTTQTNGVSTDAIVHQDATHNHDDRYATSPNTDDAGTLSFDHSKGGDAVNYYLKVYASSGGSLVHNYQMFSNVSNSADLACFFNVNLSANQVFKIYSANGDWYGYDSFSSSSASAFTEGASNHDIRVVTAGAYDVYLTESGGVWVTPHSDTTTSVTQGDKTGYYIIGNATDSDSALTGHSTFAAGIPMYVNAAANTTDLAFYAGLRLTAGDSFSVVKDSGDTLIYYAAQTEYFDSGSGKTSTENFLTKTDYFAKDGSGNAVITNKSYNSGSSAWHKLDVRQETGTDSGAPTTTFFCRQTGYYNIALSVDQTNSSYPDKEGRVADIHVGLWDGKDVLGNRYKTSSKSSGPTRKGAASTEGQIDRIYLQMNGNANWSADSAHIYVRLWRSGTSDVTFIERSDTNTGYGAVHTFDVSSVSFTPNAFMFVRTNGTWDGSNWDGNKVWNKTGDLSVSSSVNTYRFKYKDNWTEVEANGTTSEHKYADGYYYFKTTNSSGSDWDDGKFTFLGSSLPTASISLSFVKNEYFKVVRLSDYKRLFHWDSFSGTKDWKTPQGMIVVEPSRDGYMTDTGYYGNCQAGKAFSCSFVFTDESKYQFSLSSYTVTLKGVYGGTQEPAGSESVVSGESLTAPALPTTPHYGYSAPTSWNTKANGSGTSYAEGASVPVSGNMTLYAIYGDPTTKTYYFDIYDLPDGCPLRTTFKVHAWWSQGGACETDYTATKVNGSYTHWWKVTLPYASDLHFQVHAGENHQGDHGSPFDGSATNKTIYKLTGWSLYGDDTRGTTVGTLTYEVVHTVTLYKAWKRGNIITDGDALATTYLILDGETWNVPNPLSGLFSATTGWTTPTSLHKDSNTGTEYNQGTGILISSNTPAVSLYGVYVLEEYKFRVCQSTTVEGNTYNPITGASVDWNVESSETLTISNVHLEQGKRWYIDDNTGSHGGSDYGGTITWNTGGFVLTNDEISFSASGITSGTKADKDNYFERSGDNIRTKIGGTYDITITRASKTITAVALKSFDSSDFVIRGKGAAFGTQDRDFDPGDQLTANAVSPSGKFADFLFDTTTFNVGDQFKLYRDQGSSTDVDNWSNSFSGSDKFFVDPQTTHNIRSGVHNTVGVIGRLDVETGAFSIVFSNESETNCNNIKFDHAESAGIYIETTSAGTDSSPDWSASQKTMMHATAAQYDYSNSTYTYQAQESPFTTSGGKMYMRIFRTKSNNSSTAPTDEDTIRSLTEDRYYKTTDNLSSSGFTENGGGYLVVTASGNWTISLRQDGHFNDGRGPIEIAQFSGNESIGVEHTVPYWLIGTGKPGSELRNSDFTIGNGKRLYTYGGNSDSLPAYVGAVGGTGSSSAPYGSGINLKKGDRFAISTSSDKVSSVNGSSGTGWTASSGIITITQSGKYRIWLVDSSGPQINISQISSTSDLDQDGGTNVVGYDKEYGIKTAGVTSPGTISFGGNLDYSLLDAYQESGYRFVIELNSKSTGVNGTMNYKVNNGNSTYGIKVRAKTAPYSTGAFTTESLTSIAASGSSASNFHTATISSGNTTTILIEVVIPASAIKAMLAAHGTLGFSMSVDCLFQEEISAS